MHGFLLEGTRDQTSYHSRDDNLSVERSRSSKNKDTPIVLKRQVYDHCILSTVTYGSETWNLTKQQTLKLELCREPMKESC